MGTATKLSIDKARQFWKHLSWEKITVEEDGLVRRERRGGGDRDVEDSY